MAGRACIDAQRPGQSQRRAHVPADDAAGGRNPQLPAEPPHQIPDLLPLMRLRGIQSARALFADAFAAFAVSSAPAELPFGKGDETFFSDSSACSGAR